MNKKVCTWKDVEDYINNVSKRIKEEVNLDECPGIFTFPRGGLVLAVMLSHKLDLPILSNPAKNCIIIDDICDTGITLKKYSEERSKKNYFITTMLVQEDQLSETAEYNCVVDYFEYIKHKDWVVYPWEME